MCPQEGAAMNTWQQMRLFKSFDFFDSFSGGMRVHLPA
jgi:hypothetical protein